MERIVVRDHIYPSLQCPPLGLIFEDQHAFRPTGSTTAALIKLIHEVIAIPESNPYVILYAIDFLRRSITCDTAGSLASTRRWNCLTASITGSLTYYELTHCSRFGDVESATGPASYVVTGSDLRPLTPSKSMVKFADDTYIWSSQHGSCAEEI